MLVEKYNNSHAVPLKRLQLFHPLGPTGPAGDKPCRREPHEICWLLVCNHYHILNTVWISHRLL